MKKKQDGKTLQHRYAVERHAMLLGHMLRDWEKLQKETIESWIILVITELARWTRYQPTSYQSTPTESDNRRDTDMYCRDGVWFGPLTQSDIEWNKKVNEFNKQETTMWYNINEDVNAQSKNYFLRELNNIVTKKQNEAAVRFGIESPRPKTMAEADEWLKAGKFRLGDLDFDMKEIEYSNPYHLAEWLHWVDPTIVKDEVGYSQYVTKLSAETKRIERILVACRLDHEDFSYDRDGDSDYNVVIDAIEQLETWNWTPPVKVIPLSTTDSETEVALAA